ncbi:MAG TPA: PD-(D/E)XK nuclease family protein [Nitrospirota bacterium]|nr:PD-(D/E)XK nuclease family protein [Nitrospirota bacterium]
MVERILARRPKPPFLYHDVLLLVPASRLRRTYGRMFLDAMRRQYGAAALVPPAVLTFHQFCFRLYNELGQPPVVDEISRLVLLEDIVRQCMADGAFSEGSSEILAPALSASVADMIEQFSFAGIGPDRLASAVGSSDFSDKPQVKLLLEAYVRYRRTLSELGITDPAGMFAALADRFDPGWLAPYSSIVIDGINDADELEARLLVKILNNHADCTLLVDAPSPEAIANAHGFHPLELMKNHLRRLGATPVPCGAPAAPEDLFLQEALFSEKGFDETAGRAGRISAFPREIRHLAAVNMREEAALIGREVKKSLQRGTPADGILVAFPALDKYAPLVEEIFTDYGIPYNRALGRQLGASPVAAAVVSLLRAVQDDFSTTALLRVFSSPFLKFGERRSLAAKLDRLTRRQRLTGGREKILAAVHAGAGRDGGTTELGNALTDLFNALAPLCVDGPRPLAQWMESLGAIMDWSGAGERVDAIKGPLSVNLQAYEKLRETFGSMERAGGLFPSYSCTFTEWSFLIRRMLMHARFQVPPDDEGGVQILGLEESVCRAWREIYLGGLVETEFPQRVPQNIFLPEGFLESLGAHRPDRARLTAAGHFYRLLLSAPRVLLTRPENEGDRPVTPSPFLMELEPLRRAGLLNRGIDRVTGLQFGLSVEESRSVPELAKAVCNARHDDGLSALLTGDARLSGIASALEEQPPAPPQRISPGQRVFSVTELDQYLRCPYDYYIRRVLGIEPLAEVSEDMSPLSRGSKIHTILRNFYLEWKRDVTKDNREEARALLVRLGDSVFAGEPDTFRNRRERELFRTVMTSRFLDAEEMFWTQGMKPVCLEQSLELRGLTLPDGSEAVLTAKIDRIDADENGNFIIVDYKTGGYPAPKTAAEQDIFQLPVYAVMARTLLSGAEPALRRAIGLAYYDLAGKNGAGARDVVLYDRDVQPDQPAVRPRASQKTAAEFEAILTRSMEKARDAIAGVLSGDFLARPHSENVCRFCTNDSLCEREDTDVS